jgi:hypothetical protein
MNRRHFLVTTSSLVALALPGFAWARSRACGHAADHEVGHDTGRAAGHHAVAVTHPVPRPGITGDAVLPDDQVSAKAKEAYAAAREFPEVLDGLYCHCDCGERDGLRSLLSCFESKMPQTCGICRGEAEMAARLAREGMTLEEIRKAVDKRYGS